MNNCDGSEVKWVIMKPINGAFYKLAAGRFHKSCIKQAGCYKKVYRASGKKIKKVPSLGCFSEKER